MVNKEDWDADERNKQNSLWQYLASLTRHQQQMIKGIVSKYAFDYLWLEEKDFLKQLQDSLTLNELAKLSDEEKKFREKLIEDTMAVWRRNKSALKQNDKNREREQKEEEFRASVCSMNVGFQDTTIHRPYIEIRFVRSLKPQDFTKAKTLV